MKDFIINSVPEYAEFHKYWVVEETGPQTLLYKNSYFTETEAIEFINNSAEHNLKLIKNRDWSHGRELINGK